MQASPPQVLRLGATAIELGRLYPWLEAAAQAHGLPAALLNGMHVALEETVANAFMHAFPEGAPGEMVVTLVTTGSSTALVVEDNGRAFDPTGAAARSRAATLEDAQPGGLGLTLLRHYCKDIAYERAEDRNRLTLTFPLPVGGSG